VTAPESPGDERRPGFIQRRRDKFVAEIQRNRAGDHRVPTWVLALALFTLVALWAAVIVFS
jgi:fatty acid desaturase